MSHSIKELSVSRRIERIGTAHITTQKDYSTLKLWRNGGQSVISSITASEVSDWRRELFLKFDL